MPAIVNRFISIAAPCARLKKKKIYYWISTRWDYRRFINSWIHFTPAENGNVDSADTGDAQRSSEQSENFFALLSGQNVKFAWFPFFRTSHIYDRGRRDLSKIKTFVRGPRVNKNTEQTKIEFLLDVFVDKSMAAAAALAPSVVIGSDDGFLSFFFSPFPPPLDRHVRLFFYLLLLILLCLSFRDLARTRTIRKPCQHRRRRNVKNSCATQKTNDRRRPATMTTTAAVGKDCLKNIISTLDIITLL